MQDFRHSFRLLFSQVLEARLQYAAAGVIHGLGAWLIFLEMPFKDDFGLWRRRPCTRPGSDFGNLRAAGSRGGQSGSGGPGQTSNLRGGGSHSRGLGGSELAGLLASNVQCLLLSLLFHQRLLTGVLPFLFLHPVGEARIRDAQSLPVDSGTDRNHNCRKQAKESNEGRIKRYLRWRHAGARS